LPARQIAGIATLQMGRVAGGTVATYLDRKIAHGLAVAIYFFHADGGACMAPIIVGNG
jgi:hypothetical protein